MGFSQPVGENDANPKTRLFHVDFKSLARMNKKNPWLFWWTVCLYVNVLVVSVCACLNIANIVGLTECCKDAKKQIRGFASQAIASHFTSTIGSAIGAV
ncbi:Golgi apparatus membrane protein [Salix suchowensis]|nr:Golgi apparatus membrane protein [Salix suchowensis]